MSVARKRSTHAVDVDGERQDERPHEGAVAPFHPMVAGAFLMMHGALASHHERGATNGSKPSTPTTRARAAQRVSATTAVPGRYFAVPRAPSRPPLCRKYRKNSDDGSRTRTSFRPRSPARYASRLRQNAKNSGLMP